MKSAPPTTALVRGAARSRAALRAELSRWFRAERRALPWRATRDPYAIWISEAMLQQTRVEVVIPYFTRFLARFPDVHALAAADESEVLASWSGLGYYTRARALHGAARAMVAHHAGQPPRTRAEWLALPGVGPYTAGAVLSIAFGQSEPLVDGNVQRVFARLFALEPELGSRALLDACWELARLLVPARDGALDPGEWNQALMELGARVCTPRAPQCSACPLRAHCAARARGREHELPRARPRPAPLDVRLEILVPRVAGELVLVRRALTGRMAGMWEFPTRELVPDGTPSRLWPAAHTLAWQRGAALGELAHTITRHRIRAEVFAGRARARLPAAARRVSREDLVALALTGLTRKALALSVPAHG